MRFRDAVLGWSARPTLCLSVRFARLLHAVSQVQYISSLYGALSPTPFPSPPFPSLSVPLWFSLCALFYNTEEVSSFTPLLNH